MKILGCLPITSNAGPDLLTYFSSNDIPLGSLVSVSIRNKPTTAIVVSSADASDLKSEIRSSKFKLKKVSKVLSTDPFGTDYMNAISDTAKYYAANTGAVLKETLPKQVTFSKIEPLKKSTLSPQKTRLILTADKDRISEYRNLIRQTLSTGKSAVVLSPTVKQNELIAKYLGKGIERSVVICDGLSGKRKIEEAIKKGGEKDKAYLFFITPSALFLLPRNTGLIILDKENSSFYRTQIRPLIDYRFLTKQIASKLDIPLVLGGELSTPETMDALKKGEILPIGSLALKNRGLITGEIVDMRLYKPTLIHGFKILSEELINAITEARNANSHSFIYSTRKGLYPSTVCGDCGNILTCKNCDASLVLHKTNMMDRYYRCHRCGMRYDSLKRCATCDSWKLFSLGVGTENVEEELYKHFPGAKIFRLDGESARNKAEADIIIGKYYSSPGAILVGTDLALFALDESVGLGGIASLDSLFALPEFRINEKIMTILTRIKNLSSRRFVVQSRFADSPILKFGVTGDLESYYKTELDLRRQYDYPPFSIFIKLSIKGDRNKAKEELAKVAETIKPDELMIYNTNSDGFVKGDHTNGLLKIKKELWPDDQLVSKLRGLPPFIRVCVEPESLM
jgi:primosomal protein N' (replication factor Y)